MAELVVVVIAIITVTGMIVVLAYLDTLRNDDDECESECGCNIFTDDEEIR